MKKKNTFIFVNYLVHFPVRKAQTQSELITEHARYMQFFACIEDSVVYAKESATTAEVMFSYFVAGHNLPGAIAKQLLYSVSWPLEWA